MNFWANITQWDVIRLDSLYIYFENYYFSEKENEKLEIFNDFIDIFWKSTPNFKKYKTKYGWSCRLMTVEDDPDKFLRYYINYLFAKYCCKEMWTKHSKFDYDYKRFKIVINYYLKKIFNNYIPISIYESNNEIESNVSMNDLYGEDGYVVTYVINSLRGYFINRVKRYLSGKYIECKCGAQVLKKSNRQSMCKECFNNQRRIYKTEKQRKYRSVVDS